MSILVTGVTGFVGRYVLQQLRQKYQEDKLLVLSSGKIKGVKNIASNNYEFDNEYLLNNGCQNVEIIIHIGAWTPKSGKDVDKIKETTSNIVNTQRLLMSNFPALKKVIYCSTLDIYNNTQDIISEDTITIPKSMYAWSKLYCEKLLINLAKEKNIIYEILRLGHVYGEGEEKYQKVLPTMIRKAIKGENLIIYGDGEAIRTFIYIDDVAKAIIKSIDLETSNVINVVGKEPITVNQLAKMIISNCDNSVQIEYVPTAEKNKDYLFDNRRMEKYLLNKFTPFEVGLQREIQYMKEYIL